MPRHKQVTACRKSGGPTSKSCSCEHCALSVCSVCGGAEGTLTTDCPGTQINGDRQQETVRRPSTTPTHGAGTSQDLTRVAHRTSSTQR